MSSVSASSSSVSASSRYVVVGAPDHGGCDNSVFTAKYTLLTFLPIGLREQFRRNGNVYFLCVGGLMWVGTYTPLFESAIEPWTTLGPLAVVVSVSLAQEGLADLARHRSDAKANAYPVTVLRHGDGDGGEKERIVPRRSLVPGDLVLIRNREMVPADVVLLASSNDRGTAYVETSSVDGETNLKLRESPDWYDRGVGGKERETLDEVFRRLEATTALRPDRRVPATRRGDRAADPTSVSLRQSSARSWARTAWESSKRLVRGGGGGATEGADHVVDDVDATSSAPLSSYATVLTSELPNASVNTFRGRLTLPPTDEDSPTNEVPLGADHLLLRGAVLRNTEWCVGVVCFAGADTKLVRNAVATPSKFSRLDVSINRIVWGVLVAMLALGFVEAALSVRESRLYFKGSWYLGYGTDVDAPWPYLRHAPDSPHSHVLRSTPVEWRTSSFSLAAMFMTFLTLNNNLVPLSLYITMEMVTFFLMWVLDNDLDMYHAETDSPAVARSTIVSDLGRVDHVFSDKTGTLTRNVMRFSRCDVEGIAYGEPTVDDRDDDDDDDHLPLEDLDPTTSLRAELFLLVMALCHTVVVEKDLDRKVEDEEDNDDDNDVSDLGLLSLGASLRRRRKKKKESHRVPPPSADGAPAGMSYQAESPDEGALVSAAATVYGVRLADRRADGLVLSRDRPSPLRRDDVVAALKEGRMANVVVDSPPIPRDSKEEEEEVWRVLAVNKFDSDRKRMSVLVRSPPTSGSLPMVLCKGADSAMASRAVDDDDEDDEILLRSRAHLGDFASEGLRTLVLGARVLTEEQCEDLLRRHAAASSAIDDREGKLREVADAFEDELRLVGATAIEDRLQDGVPDTVAALAKSGIRLWVLTGDKRETAVEIGYATRVLDPAMRLLQIVEASEEEVRTALATEFLHMVKRGLLPDYQRAALANDGLAWRDVLLLPVTLLLKLLKLIYDLAWWIVTRPVTLAVNLVASLLRRRNKDGTAVVVDAAKDDAVVYQPTNTVAARRRVRERADDLSRRRTQRLQVNGHRDHDVPEEDLDERPPGIFSRASSARAVLSLRRSSRSASASVRNGAAHAPSNHHDHDHDAAADDDVSLISVRLDDDDGLSRHRKKQRTTLERLFATDPAARKGVLDRHVQKANRERSLPNPPKEDNDDAATTVTTKRALVIEGGALSKLLGDPVSEQMLFAVANNCSSVVACRVSPKQKALLVALVRRNVHPEPVTLAIGDGANDVGMIQEAHVGVGVSGLEGRQAVNASDFSIAQFRFLKPLLLVHGRWNFYRTSKVVLFSFYKNALLVVTLAYYSTHTMYSGTPLYDQWTISILNFVSGIPIVLLGMFDRDLEKDHVLRHPGLYSSGRDNEHMAPRACLRYALLCVAHATVLGWIGINATNRGGADTAFRRPGLAVADDRPGDGEGRDRLSAGVVNYTVLVIVLALKVLLETRAVVIGEFPTWTCRRGVGEGWPSRTAYTISGIVVFSLFFWIASVFLYSYVGTTTDYPDWIQFANAPYHALGKNNRAWVVILFVPVVATLPDVALKLFANLYFPNRAQIHAEIAAEEDRRRHREAGDRCAACCYATPRRTDTKEEEEEEEATVLGRRL